MSIPSSHSPAITASHIADSHGLTASLSVPASPPVTDSQCCAFHGTFSAAARSQRNENRFANAHSLSSGRSRPFDSGTPRWRVRLTVRCGAAGNAGRHAAPCSARVAAEAASARRWGICGGEGGSRGGGGRGGAGGMQARAVRCAAVGGAVAEGAAAGRVAEETVLEVRRVSFQPHGSDSWLLTDVSLSLPKNSLGLIFGRSGGGKTTLLQLLSGLTTATHGTIAMPTTSPPSLSASSPASLSPNPPALTPLSRAELSERVGIVFQFPERESSPLAFRPLGAAFSPCHASAAAPFCCPALSVLSPSLPFLSSSTPLFPLYLSPSFITLDLSPPFSPTSSPSRYPGNCPPFPALPALSRAPPLPTHSPPFPLPHITTSFPPPPPQLLPDGQCVGRAHLRLALASGGYTSPTGSGWNPVLVLPPCAPTPIIPLPLVPPYPPGFSYFLTDSVLAELTFGWPSRVEDIPLRQALAARVQAALIAVRSGAVEWSGEGGSGVGCGGPNSSGTRYHPACSALSGANQPHLGLASKPLLVQLLRILKSRTNQPRLSLASKPLFKPAAPSPPLVFSRCQPTCSHLVPPSVSSPTPTPLPPTSMQVGLMGVALDTNPRALSGGNQRRLALAIQLVSTPSSPLRFSPHLSSDAGAAAAGRTSCGARLEGEGGRGEAAGGT
ncbi:unnamed protein product [Closterium sp. Naga37s-1]|nr:unnamed protein product [Closterium sp. Naga37s-1]